MLHLAMLAALIALAPDAVMKERERPLTVTLSLPRGSDAVAATRAAVAEAVPRPAMPMAPPLQPEAPPEEPRPSIVDPVALMPIFDAEPDPALTGDTVSAASADAIDVGPSGEACPIVASLRQALERDAAIGAALMRIPRASRSVANAVMLWDGRWVAPERAGGAATIGAIRDTIAAVLDRAAAKCGKQAILGPVFVPVTNESETLVLAFGSGEWRWEDLLREPAFAPSSDLPE